MLDELRAVVRGGGPTVAVDLAGAIAGSAGPALGAAHASANARGARTLVLNCDGVDYVNSAGVAALIQLMGAVQQAGQQMMVVGLSPHYRKVFHMMGLSQFAPVFETEQQALAALAATGQAEGQGGAWSAGADQERKDVGLPP